MAITKLSQTMAIILAIAAGTATAGTAQAGIVLLTFDRQGEAGAQQACTGADGGAVDRLCVDSNSLIGANYGSTAALGVSYDTSGPLTSLRSIDSIFNPVSGTTGQSTANGNLLSFLTFTPAAGFEVSFIGLDYFNVNASFLRPTLQLFDSGGNTIGSFATVGSTAIRNYAFNSAYFSGPLKFGFSGGDTFNPLGIDNVRLDVRAIAAVGVVPEPASWALMISGFGLVGGAMRRRRANPATQTPISA